MLRQMRLLYCRSNKLIVNIFLTQHKNPTFSKFRASYNNVYRKIFGLKRLSSAIEMFALSNISNFKALMRKSMPLLHA